MPAQFGPRNSAPRHSPTPPPLAAQPTGFVKMVNPTPLTFKWSGDEAEGTSLALAALEDGVEAVQNSSSDEESCCDLTQATVEGGDRTPPPPSESSDEDLVDLTQSRVRARDAPTPARDGASSSSDDDDDGNHEADARVAIAQKIKASPELYEPILLRKKVDVNAIALACGADPKTVKAYLDDEGVPNVRRRAVQKRTRVRSPQPS